MSGNKSLSTSGLAVPIPGGELATNLEVVVTPPGGTATVLGNFTSDFTGGTYTQYIPSQIGNYTFHMFYGGQTLTESAKLDLGDFEAISWDPAQAT